jgi:hypothetical protein
VADHRHVGMFITVFGLATWFNDLKAARRNPTGR